MHWHENDAHPFSGVAAKLKRTKETVDDLNGRIRAFFEASKYPRMPDINSQEFLDACNYHETLSIPKEFSIISGEVVHHLRSSLDHIVWHFSSDAYRASTGNAIGFPVSCTQPKTKTEIEKFERKIKGINKKRVLDLIRQLQPYARPDPLTHLLSIVHDMDRFDKHREIAIVNAGGAVDASSLALSVGSILERYCQEEELSDDERRIAQNALKNDCGITPNVVFPKFRKGKSEFVVPALSQLGNAVFDVVGLFADEV